MTTPPSSPSRIPSPADSGIDPDDSLAGITWATPLLDSVLSGPASPTKKLFEFQASFANRQKSTFVDALTEEFSKRGVTSNLKLELSKLTMEELSLVEMALQNGFSPKRLGKDPLLAANSFAKAQSYLPLFRNLMGEHVTPDLLKTIANDLTQAGCQLQDSAPDFYKDLDAFLEQAQVIQNDFPNIALNIDQTPQTKNFAEHAEMLVATTASFDPKTFIGVIKDIQDRTIMVSDHALEEVIEGCAGDTSLGRTAQHLTPRLPNAPWGLWEEQHPAKLADGIVDFDLNPLEVEIVISDPTSLESRTVRMQLPLHGKMSSQEAREHIETFASQARDNLSLDASSEFASCLRQAKTDMAKAVYDFNVSAKKQGGFALQEPVLQELASSPSNLIFACRAASLGHLFLTNEGQLSLLPNKEMDIFVPLPLYQVSNQDLANLQAAVLFGQGKIEISNLVIKNDLPDISTQCPLQITTFREVRNGSPYLNLILNIDGVERQTSYPLFEGPRFTQTNEITEELKKEQLASSKLLERDFLLAKAKYLRTQVLQHFSS